MAFHETVDRPGFAPGPQRPDETGHRLMNHLGYALLRFAAGGAIFLNHGIHKVASSIDPEFLEDIRASGLPAPEFFARFSGLTEAACGLLLALGLLTRPAALLLVVDMFVTAFLLKHAGDPYRFELALVYFLLALSLAVGGGGRYSLDTPIARWRERRKQGRARIG